MKEIWFDMDGTIADLYGVENWLSMLIAEDTTPYEIARPLLRMATLARVLNGLRRKGYTINIISWTSKSGSIEYNQAVAAAKKAWLRKHLASVKFDRVDIVDYGTPKGEGREGILFDDEERNRAEWNGIAYNVTDILGVLKAL